MTRGRVGSGAEVTGTEVTRGRVGSAAEVSVTPVAYHKIC